jgi:hypothetical protein
MINHPTHTFSATDALLLAEHGYCIGYDIDGNSAPAMAVHPETGMIIRNFWSGCSIWHPSEKRTKEKVGSNMVSILSYAPQFERSDKYSKWHTRSGNLQVLATLRNLTAESNA